jgi:hypothetical protein
MTSVVVIGQRLPQGSRRIVEDRFAADLQRRGVRAAASYGFLGEGDMSNAEARALLLTRGFDGALILSLEHISERPRYVPGHYYGGGYGYGWGGMYSYSPGYYVVDQIVNFDTTLLDLRTGKPVWSASTRTENPSSSADYAKSMSKKVMNELSDHGFLSPSDDD